MLYAFKFNEGGTVDSMTAYYPPYPEIVSNGLFYVTENEELGEAGINKITATIEGGVVVGTPQIAADPPTLWVHVTLSGNPALVTSPAGTLYLKNDGVDALQVQAQLRDGPDLATSEPVAEVGGEPITAVWALELVNVDTGVLADTPLVQMTNGAINVNYKTTIAPCEVELAENRFEKIGPYQLRLAQPVRFKVVRVLE